jgi:hypothetical protein
MKIIQPISDAMMPGDIFHECPICGNDKMDVKTEICMSIH